MRARVLAFPTPRTPVFRRSGPLRWVAALILLLVAAVVALVLSSIARSPETRPRRALQEGAGGRPSGHSV